MAYRGCGTSRSLHDLGRPTWEARGTATRRGPPLRDPTPGRLGIPLAVPFEARVPRSAVPGRNSLCDVLGLPYLRCGGPLLPRSARAFCAPGMSSPPNRIRVCRTFHWTERVLPRISNPPNTGGARGSFRYPYAALLVTWAGLFSLFVHEELKLPSSQCHRCRGARSG